MCAIICIELGGVMKIKLNIKLNDTSYQVNAIKNNNEYIYKYENNIIIINKENKTIKVKNKDSINIMYLDKKYGIINIKKQKIKYNFDIIKLNILNNYILIIYKIDEINKFILEEVYE